MVEGLLPVPLVPGNICGRGRLNHSRTDGTARTSVDGRLSVRDRTRSGQTFCSFQIRSLLGGPFSVPPVDDKFGTGGERLLP